MIGVVGMAYRFRAQACATRDLFAAAALAAILGTVSVARAVPLAIVETDALARVGRAVVLDGSASHDPQGQLLRYRWSLVTAPEGSRAAIDAADPAPALIPDRPGAYVLELVVEAADGARSAPQRRTIVASEHALAATPVASDPRAIDVDAGDDVATVVGQSVPLAATLLAREASSYRVTWDLVSRPERSALETRDIAARDQLAAQVAPDVAGAYVFRVTADAGASRVADNVLVRVYAAGPGARDAAPAAAQATASTPAATASSSPASDAIAADGFPIVAQLSVSPTHVAVLRGQEATFTLALEAQPRMNAVVAMSVDGLPAGATARFDPPRPQIGDAFALRIQVAADGRTGAFPLQIRAALRGRGARFDVTGNAMLDVRRFSLGVTDASCVGGPLPTLASTVYVSPTGADGAGCGTSTSTPCATIAQGIANCGASCGVLVRYGRYPTTATITMRDGVHVIGSCDFGTPPADGAAAANYRSIVDASPAPGTPAISASGIASPTTLRGLVVLGKNETAPGTASIAMAVASSTGLALVGNVLAAGKGGDGTQGTTTNGAPGNQGNPSFSSEVGGTGATSCASPAGDGGQGSAYQAMSTSGCFFWCSCHNLGSTGGSGLPGGASGSIGGGGGGGPGSQGCGCTNHDGVGDGGAGGTGSPGACAAVGGVSTQAVWGTQSGVVWSPGVGMQGSIGAVGSGGGGGGAGGLAVRTPPGEVDFPGLPGGGGGSGGCGGFGGTGGQQGGASIALALSNATTADVAAANSIVPGPGGMGGKGGTGGMGGPGGSGGSGRQGHFTSFTIVVVCSATVPGSGGPGGTGGTGGAGSGGSGGNGGPSIGIALASGASAGSGAGIYAGLPGAGGPGGAGGRNAPQTSDPNPCQGDTGFPGAPGGSAMTVNFDSPPPAVLPLVPGLLLPGQQLAVNQSNKSRNGNAELILQGDGNFCVYVPAGPSWCTETSPNTAVNAIMQTDGNLCVYFQAAGPWCSGTAGHPGAFLVIGDNGTLAIYDQGARIWSAP